MNIGGGGMHPDGGYVRLYRRLWEHSAFRTKQEAAVFAWMLSAAQWREVRISTRFGPVTLGVGELLIAERELAEDFGLHRNTIRALLQRMVDEGIIARFLDRSPHRAGTVVRIINYSSYQWVEHASDDAEDRSRTEGGTIAGPKEDRRRTKNNKEKESNTGNLDPPIPPLFTDDTAPPQAPDIEAAFVEWWAAVPRKVAKGAALRAYQSALKHATPAELLAGIRRYADEVRGREERFIAHPASWLNGRRWLDEPGRQGVDHAQSRTASRSVRNGFVALALEEAERRHQDAADDPSRWDGSTLDLDPAGDGGA